VAKLVPEDHWRLHNVSTRLPSESAMSITAVLHEIFTSIQGEGPFTGTPMTFVRFQGCSLRCRWCDTPDALGKTQRECRVGEDTFSNPVTRDDLTQWIEGFEPTTIALTGGEPLEQADFLAHWLPQMTVYQRFLETGGILVRQLEQVIDHVDVVSMDIKLPSSTGLRPYWNQHRDFLQCAHAYSRRTFVKAVVDRDTTTAEIDRAIQLVADVDPDIPLTLQLASPTDDFSAVPSPQMVQQQLQECTHWVNHLAIARQEHKIWGVR
jgi:7-carboxy-7-deazaguanine synthase